MNKIALLAALFLANILTAKAQCPTVSGTVTNLSCYGGASGSITLTVFDDTAGVNNPGLLISEVRTDPPSNDSNYEWMELIATDSINFATKPYTIIFSNNGGVTVNGWVRGGTPGIQGSTYAFLVNSGTVLPGDVVYVGGSLMEPTGLKLRVKATAAETGDGGIGGATTAATGVLGNGGVADGIAVFNLHVSQIDANTVPVDAIFFGTSIGAAALSDTTKGYRLPVNDRYNGGRLKSTSFLAPEISMFYSLQASGAYNRSTGIYTTARNWITNNTVWLGSISSITVSSNSFTYLWSNGATTKNLSGLIPGSYMVTVTSGSGCSVNQTFTVAQSPPLTISLSASNTSCPTGTNGSVSSSVSGGNTPYCYLWNTGATTASIAQQPAGSYTLTVTDYSGCTATSSAVVSSGILFPPLMVSLSVTNTTCPTAINGSVNSSVSGLNTPFIYLWSTGATTPSITQQPAGTYTLTVTDNVGCTASSTAAISIGNSFPPLTISLSATTTSCPAAANGTINSVVSGGSSPFSYLWSTGATGATINQQPVGNYTVTITDNSGCIQSASTAISAGNVFPQVQLTSGPIICNGTNTGNIASNVSGGSSPYTYAWSTGTTTSTITQRPAGLYTLTVTDSLGCSSTSAANIQEAPPILINSITPSSNSSGFPVLLNGLNLSNITQVLFGNLNADTFSITSDTSILAVVPSDAQHGTVIVVDNNGCVGTSSAVFTYIASNPELTVRLFIEGIYVTNDSVVSPLFNNGLSSNPLSSDSLELLLVSPGELASIAFKKKTILFSNGQATITLPGWILGNSYYILIRHRNSLETWSKIPVAFTQENTYFNASGMLSYPTVVSGIISAITNNSANCSGLVQNDGGDTVNIRGFCWSIFPKPTLALSTKTVNGSGSGSFNGNLSGLLPGTKYYIRAYASNDVGTAYGQEVSFTTSNFPTDIDGNVYDTAVIGNQVWMTKNLRVSKYRNGDPIDTGLSDSAWQSTINGAYAIYNNISINDSIYGKLYNWYAVADSRGLCPSGWHVPGESDWSSLQNFLGGSSLAGGMMKAISPLWLSPNTGATNSSGFTGLPGGFRSNDGTFNNIGSYGCWWSFTQYSSTVAWFDFLENFNTNLTRFNLPKTYGFSVRCVRDVVPSLTTLTVAVLTSNNANSGGNITDSGGDSVSVRGICWSTSPNPTVFLSTKTTNGSGSGIFNSSITGLQPSTTYYVRAYATNNAGTGYGNQVAFTTLAAGQFTDIDGFVYDTVAIGTQVWMKQNLKVTKYRNGNAVPTGLSNSAWQNTTSGAYVVRINSSVNDSIYGKLYNWYAVVDPRGLCPTGWHAPGDAEWRTLENFLGGASIAGGKMKAVSPLWYSPNMAATNSSGFTGLPGGYCNNNDVSLFPGIGGFANWWISKRNPTTGYSCISLPNSTGEFTKLNAIFYGNNFGFSVRCLKDIEPIIYTSALTVTNTGTATCSGFITDSGGDSVTVRGVCWSTSPNPTVSLSTKTNDGTGSGGFTASITGLQPGTTYYVRAYATNGTGTGYGNQVTFTDFSIDQLTDIDGNIYDTIVIGTQVWMKQNLRVSKYRNGEPIPANLSQGGTSGAYGVFDNSPTNNQVFGKLYNHYAVADLRGLCPSGWHVPSDAEWTILENFLGGSGVAGSKMKAVTSLWDSPYIDANNSSGFTALPGGSFPSGSPGQGSYVGFNASWWSSNMDFYWPQAYFRMLIYNYTNVMSQSNSRSNGYSVRCIRD